MKVAIICPLGLMSRYGSGIYHLSLAHLINHEPAYAAFYWQQTQYHNSFVMMDNSMIELGRPVGFDDLTAAAKATRPSEIILPDFKDNPHATLTYAKKFAPMFKEMFPDTKLQAVPHWHSSRSISDWLLNYADLCAIPEIDTIGLGKFLGDQRGSIVRSLIRGRDESKEYHLLGTWGNPIEIRPYAQLPWIRGVDSKAPVRLGQHCIALHPESGLMVPTKVRELLPPMDFHYSEDPIPSITVHNVKVFREWALGRTEAEVINLGEGSVR